MHVQSWMGPAVLAAVSFAAYHVAMKVAADRIDRIPGAVVLQAVAALCGLVALAVLTSTRGAPRATSAGIAWAAAAGVAVGLAEILTFAVFSLGAPASRAAPLILGGTVLFAAVLGALLLRETLGPVQWLGIGLIVAGVALVAR